MLGISNCKIMSTLMAPHTKEALTNIYPQPRSMIGVCTEELKLFQYCNTLLSNIVKIKLIIFSVFDIYKSSVFRKICLQQFSMQGNQ